MKQAKKSEKKNSSRKRNYKSKNTITEKGLIAEVDSDVSEHKTDVYEGTIDKKKLIDDSSIAENFITRLECESADKNSLKHESKLVERFITVHDSFNKGEVKEAIKKIEGKGFELHIKAYKEFRLVARRHEISYYNFNKVCDDLINKDLLLEIKFNMALAIKFTLLHHNMLDSNNLHFQKLLYAFYGSGDKNIKSELASCLAIFIKTQDQNKPTNNLQELTNKLPTIDISNDAKIQLSTALEENRGQRLRIPLVNERTNRQKNQKINKPKAVVTKTQQRIKNKYNNTQSEETDVQIMSIADALKNRKKKKLNQNRNQDITPSNVEAGSDRGWLTSCYVDVKNLYNKINNGGRIKKEDLDYLNKRIFPSFTKNWGSGGLFGQFIITRMTVSSLAKICSPQGAKQALSDTTMVNMLTLCLNFEKVKKLVLPPIHNSYDIYHCSGWTPNPKSASNNNIEKSFECLREVFDSYGGLTYEKENEYVDKFNSIVNREIDNLRLDAITGVYNNSILTKGAYIRGGTDKKGYYDKLKELINSETTKNPLQIIQDRVEDSNPEIAKVAARILTNLADDSQVDYKKLFHLRFKHLQNQQDLEESIIYIHSQSLDLNRCKELFTQENISIIILNLAFNQRNSPANHKTLLLDIINNYLEVLPSNVLSEMGLQSLVAKVILSKDFDTEIKKEALTAILLHTQNQKSVPPKTLQMVLKNIQEIQNLDNSGNAMALLIATLAEISKTSPLKDLEPIAHLLNNNRVIIIEGKEISLEQRNKENETYPSISTLAAKIITDSLSAEALLSKDLFEKMIDTLNSQQKQTKILISKALYEAKNSNRFTQDQISRLQSYFDDSVNDVSIYTKLAFVKFIDLWIANSDDELLYGSSLDNLATIYAMEDRLMLQENDYTEDINKQILDILLIEAQKQPFESEALYELFNYLLLQDENVTAQQKCIKILAMQVHKGQLLPSTTISSLEEYAARNKYAENSDHNELMTLLKSIIKNGQRVGNITISIFADEIFSSTASNHDKRSAFDLLDFFDKNYHIPSQEIFEILEVERAAYSLAKPANSRNQGLAIKFLHTKTAQGIKLSPQAFASLGKHVTDSTVLATFLNSTINKQVVPASLFSKIAKLPYNHYLSQECQGQVLDIISQMIANDAVILHQDIEAFEYSMKHGKLDQGKYLNIAADLLQKGYKVSEFVLMRMCDILVSQAETQADRQNIMHALILCAAHPELSNSRVPLKVTFLKVLNDKDPGLSTLAARGIYNFSRNSNLDLQTLNSLLINISAKKITQKAKEDLLKVLENEENLCGKLGIEAKEIIKLFKLRYRSDSEFLSGLNQIPSIVLFADQDFERLACMLRNKTLLNDVLNFLSLYLEDQQLQKKEVVEKVKEVSDVLVIVLYELFASTSSSNIKDKAYNLLKIIVDCGKRLPATILEQIAKSKDFNFTIPLVEKISKNQDLPKDLLLINKSGTLWEKTGINLSQANSFVAEIDIEKCDSNFITKIDNSFKIKLKRILKDVNDDYLTDLANQLATGKLPFATLDKLLESINSVNSVAELRSLLDFATINFITEEDIYTTDLNGQEMLRALQMKLLGNELKSKFNNQKKNKFATLVELLFDNNWTFDQLKKIVTKAKADNFQEFHSRDQNLLLVLQLISEYQIAPDLNEKIQKILSSSNYKQWLREVNKLALNKSARLRNRNELLEELNNINESNKNVTNFVSSDLQGLLNIIKDPSLKSMVMQKENQIGYSNFVLKQTQDICLNLIKSSKTIDISVLKDYSIDRKGISNKPISDWNEQCIENWASIAKLKKQYFNQPKFVAEAIAVISQANKLTTSHTLRDTQIISILILLNPQENLGRLIQVSTGEGKSTIISIFAIIQALKGHKIDIITSSPVLAERDAKEKAALYRMFGLTCADNNDRVVYVQGKKQCYTSDIVYGEVSQFQFDTLRDNYSGLGTLANRRKDIVIVDEVDSMLLDDSSKIARLATTVAGIDQLQPIYHYIWDRLMAIKQKLIKIGGHFFLVYGKLIQNPGAIALQYADEKGDIKQIPDLKAYLRFNKNIDNIARPLEGDIDTFIKENLRNYVQEFVYINWQNNENENTRAQKSKKSESNSPSYEKLKIPKNFHEFVKGQLPKWLDSAFTAFTYAENVHYIVQNGIIKPVDYNSTGLVQSSTSWSEGLHQFLQIKHGLKITSETFTTNFLSNVGYFSDDGKDIYGNDDVQNKNIYGKNIYGLTGTLGSDKAKQLIKEVYKVDLVTIPRSYEQLYKRLPTISAPNREIWRQEVTTSAINEAYKGRGSLVICQTIEDADDLTDILKSKYRSGAVKQYTMNDMHQQNEVEKIYQGDIIVATNLAGRGTDIKTQNIEAFGGMHVIVTFMPPNKRVEDQAFGRTARQGNRGTGQMIINKATLPFGDIKAKEIQKMRDLLQAENLENFLQKELKVIEFKEKLFKKYCSTIKSLRQKIRSQEGKWQGIKNYGKSWFVNVSPSVFQANIIASVEEQWAMMLKKVDDGPIDKNLAINDFKNLDSNIFQNLNGEISSIIKNPYYHIAIANDMLANTSLLDRTYDRVLNHLNQAIEADPDFSAPAHASKAWLLLKFRTRIGRYSEKQECYKSDALKELEEALKLGSEEMGTLCCMQKMSVQLSGASSDLSKQWKQKMNILGSHLNSLQSNIDSIKRSQRRMDIVGFTKEKEEHKYFSSENFIEDVQFNEEKFFFSLSRNKEGMLEGSPKPYGYDAYSVAFNDLTVREDSGTIDQAVDTVKILISNSKLEAISNLGHQAYNYSKNVYSKAKKLAYGRKNEEEEIFINNRNVKNRYVFASGYNSISILIKNSINANKLKSILNPNIEAEDLTKEDVLQLLNEEVGFLYKHIFPEKWSSKYSAIQLKLKNKNREVIQKQNWSKNTKFAERGTIKIVCDFLNENKEDTLRYDLVLENANKPKSEAFSKAIELIIVNIEFLDLSPDKVKEKVDALKPESISLTLTGQKQRLGALLNHKEFKKIESVQKIKLVEADKATTFSKNFALEAIQISKLDFLQIKLENLPTNSVLDIFNLSKQLDEADNQFNSLNFFSLKLNKVDSSSKGIKCLLENLHQEQIILSFTKLNKESAISIIPLLRKENFDFKLIFEDINSSQLKDVIEQSYKAQPQEEVQLSKIKNLSEMFMPDMRPQIELCEFSARGIEFLLEIGERRFVPWFSVASLGMIAGVQIAVGAVLATTGFGSTVGMGIITQGMADVFNAYRAYSTRQFSWHSYGQQKAVSLAISAVSMGWDKIKDGGKGAKNLFVGIKGEAREQIGTRVLTNGKDISQTLKYSASNLKSLAFKQTVTSLGEAGTRELSNKLTEGLSHCLMNQLRPTITSSIQSKVQNKFSGSDLLPLLCKMHALDTIQNEKTNKSDKYNPRNQSNELKSRINSEVAKTLNPQNNWLRKQWDSVGGPLCKGILSDSRLLGSSFSMGMRILGTLNGLHQINSIIDTTHENLSKGLSRINKENLTTSKILARYAAVPLGEAVDIEKSLIQQGVILVENKSEEENLLSTTYSHVTQMTTQSKSNLRFHCESINLDLLNQDLKSPQTVSSNMWNNSLEFLRKLSKVSKEMKPEALSEIMKSVSDSLTDQIIRIIESQLISPWSSYGVGTLTNHLSSKVQNHFIQKQLSNEVDDIKGQLYTLTNKENQTAEDKNRIRSLQADLNEKVGLSKKTQTYSSMIEHEAEKYTKAYSQCEAIHYQGQKSKNNNSSSEEAKKYADEIRQGSTPASYSDIIAMADQHGINVKVVDDPNYQLTETEKANGVRIVVFIKGGKDAEGNDTVGHYMYMDKNGNLKNVPTDDNANNCGFNVMRALIKEEKNIDVSIQQLRDDCADHALANSDTFSKGLDAQSWMRERYPKEINSLLGMGGKWYNPFDDDFFVYEGVKYVRQNWDSIVNGIKITYTYITVGGALFLSVVGTGGAILVPIISGAIYVNSAVCILDAGKTVYEKGIDDEESLHKIIEAAVSLGPVAKILGPASKVGKNLNVVSKAGSILKLSCNIQKNGLTRENLMTGLAYFTLIPEQYKNKILSNLHLKGIYDKGSQLLDSINKLPNTSQYMMLKILVNNPNILDSKNQFDQIINCAKDQLVEQSINSIAKKKGTN